VDAPAHETNVLNVISPPATTLKANARPKRPSRGIKKYLIYINSAWAVLPFACVKPRTTIWLASVHERSAERDGSDAPTPQVGAVLRAAKPAATRGSYVECRAGCCGLYRAGESSMADTPKLSVEKALGKLRKSDQPKSKSEQHDDKTDALKEEIRRMTEQRLRLERHQRKRAPK
jgi:hypothetical protein